MQLFNREPKEHAGPVSADKERVVGIIDNLKIKHGDSISIKLKDEGPGLTGKTFESAYLGHDNECVNLGGQRIAFTIIQEVGVKRAQ